MHAWSRRVNSTNLKAACDELAGLQPKAITVAVKRLAGKASSLSLSHDEAKRQIRESAQKAISRVREYTPWKIAGPVEMVFEFLPQADQPARTSRYAGQTVLEAYEAWLGKL